MGLSCVKQKPTPTQKLSLGLFLCGDFCDTPVYGFPSKKCCDQW